MIDQSAAYDLLDHFLFPKKVIEYNSDEASKWGSGVNNTPKSKFSELGYRDFYPVMKLNKPCFESYTVASESPSKQIKQTNCSTGTSTFPDN